MVTFIQNENQNFELVNDVQERLLLKRAVRNIACHVEKT